MQYYGNHMPHNSTSITTMRLNRKVQLTTMEKLYRLQMAADSLAKLFTIDIETQIGKIGFAKDHFRIFEVIEIETNKIGTVHFRFPR